MLLNDDDEALNNNLSGSSPQTAIEMIGTQVERTGSSMGKDTLLLIKGG